MKKLETKYKMHSFVNKQIEIFKSKNKTKQNLLIGQIQLILIENTLLHLN